METEEKEVNLVFGTNATPSVRSIIIPACCREGRDDCIHVPKRDRGTKQNIGL